MHESETRTHHLAISPLQSEDDARACARLMAASEPWVTLGRSYETSLGIIQDDRYRVWPKADGKQRGMAHAPESR